MPQLGQRPNSVPAHLAMAVACGAGDFEFTILGTSCERTPDEEMALNETESMEKKNARENPDMAAAMAMA